MKKTKRILCLVLAMALVFTCACAPVYGEGEAAEAPVYAGKYEEAAASLAGISAPSDWQTFDLAVHGILTDSDELSESVRESCVQTLVDAVSGNEPYVTDLAKAEIILGALGVDTTALELSDGSTLNNKELLAGVSEFMTYSDAVWALLAFESGDVEVSGDVLSLALDKIEENMNNDGLLFGTYGDYQYTDIDSTGAAVGALARFVRDEENAFGIKEKAVELSDKMLDALSQNQGVNGSYGSACTDAFVIIGLVSAGIDPTEDVRFVKGEGDEAKNLLDGLLSYSVEGGFSGWDGQLDMDWSTEQGFRALATLSAFEKGEKAPFNLYNIKPEDETQAPSNPDGGENTDTPSVPVVPPSTETKISVTFQMNTHEKVWIEKHTVKVEESTSVRDLIQMVFDEYGVESKGLSTGYLRSVTYKGETLKEFGVGGNSGWQYYVDGELPSRGITQYKLSDGEEVLLKFTADYTAGGFSSSEPEEDDKEDEEIKEETMPKIEYADVSENDWFFESVSFVSEKGFMTGVAEGEFAPELSLTRAMFVTVLYRIAGEPEAGEEKFEDVSDGMWYTSAVAWASEKGITSGVRDGVFAPDMPVTREQMATFIYRYAKMAGINDKKGNSAYSDGNNISSFATDAVAFAEGMGIMNGDNGAFRPKDSSKRSEAAAVFMRLYEALGK